VIGQQYSGEPIQQEVSGRSGGAGLAVVGQQYVREVEEPASRHVVGSKYKQQGSSHFGGASESGGVIAARGGGRSSSRQFVVVGSTKRRRRALQHFLKLVL